MDVQVKKTYSEVYGILNMLGSYYIDKLPRKLYSIIQTQRAEEYNPKYNPEIGLEKQEITNEALAMIMLLHLNYWCENDEDKDKIKKILAKNEQEVKEKYDIENIFKQKEKQRRTELEENLKKQEELERQNAEKERLELVEYKESFLEKIKRIFSNIFHRSKK